MINHMALYDRLTGRIVPILHKTMFWIWIWTSVATAGQTSRSVISTTVYPDLLRDQGESWTSGQAVNRLFCTMEPVPVICLLNRGHKYIFPFECMLNRTSRKFQHPNLVIALAPDPVHLSPVPFFPVAVDRFRQQDDRASRRQEYIVESCPCNCEVNCRSPVSLMYEITTKTACHDCKCISDSGIGCQCYDKFDLMFKDMDDHMTDALSKHVARNTKGGWMRSEAREPAVDTVRTSDE